MNYEVIIENNEVSIHNKDTDTYLFSLVCEDDLEIVAQECMNVTNELNNNTKKIISLIKDNRELENSNTKLYIENNNLQKDIDQIKTYIDNVIRTERTCMGQNILKQLKEGLTK